MKLQTHDLSYFLGINLSGDDSSQNMFAYQSALDMLELKKANALIMFLVGNQKLCVLVSLSNYIMFSCIEWHFLDIEWE